MDAPVFGASVLLDRHLCWLEIDLLDDQGQSPVEAELAATAGTAVQRVVEELVDSVVWEQGAFVFGMAGLATAFAFVLAGWRGQRWLDDVRRRGLGGSRGVLARSGELLLETSHGSLQRLQLAGILLE